MSDTITGFIRTWTPMAVGAAATWLARKTGFGIPETLQAEVAIWIAGGVSAAYYGLVRLAAVKWPVMGILLGVNKAPTYTSAD